MYGQCQAFLVTFLKVHLGDYQHLHITEALCTSSIGLLTEE